MAKKLKNIKKYRKKPKKPQNLLVWPLENCYNMGVHRTRCALNDNKPLTIVRKD
jgi:hypothetical protein